MITEQEKQALRERFNVVANLLAAANLNLRDVGLMIQVMTQPPPAEPEEEAEESEEEEPVDE